MPLYKPSELVRLGIHPNRNLSQNFLVDQNVLEKIMKVAQVESEDLVLEIGSGAGALLEALLKRGAHVIAVEKDHSLCTKIREWNHPQLEVREMDALDFSFEKNFPDQKCKVVANLPYHITTALLKHFLPKAAYIKTMTIMVQKEVGEKMVALPGAKKAKYSLLSLWTQCYATASYSFTVKPTSFFPPPSVYSCIVHLILHPFPFSFDAKGFFALLDRAFQHRRKMIKVSLSKEMWPREKVENALITSGISLSARPEELLLETWARFYEALLLP